MRKIVFCAKKRVIDNQHNPSIFSSTSLLEMIYETSKKIKIADDSALQVLWPCILKYVGDVTSCLAVKRTFVPIDYVTCVKIKSKFTKLQLWELLKKKSNVTTLEFVGCQGIVFCNFLNDFIYWNHKINKIVIDNCEHLARFPYFDSSESFFKFDGNTWTFGYKSIKIDLIIKGDNCYLDRMREKSPIEVVAFFIFQRQFGMNNVQNLTLIAPYLDMEVDHMLTEYNYAFFDGVFSVSDMKHDEKKALVLVTKDELTTMIVGLNSLNGIWKICSIDKDFTGDWNSLEV